MENRSTTKNPVERMAIPLYNLSVKATEAFEQLIPGFDNIPLAERLAAEGEAFILACFAAYTVPESFYPKEGYSVADDILSLMMNHYIDTLPKESTQDNQAVARLWAKKRLAVWRQLWDFADREEFTRALRQNFERLVDGYEGLDVKTYSSKLPGLFLAVRNTAKKLYHEHASVLKPFKGKTRFSQGKLSASEQIGVRLNLEVISRCDAFLNGHFLKAFLRNRMELERIVVPFLQYFTRLALEERLPISVRSITKAMKDSFLLGLHLGGLEGDSYIAARIANSHKWVIFDMHYRQKGEKGAKAFLATETIPQLTAATRTQVPQTFVDELWGFLSSARSEMRGIVQGLEETETNEQPDDEDEAKIVFVPASNWEHSGYVT